MADLKGSGKYRSLQTFLEQPAARGYGRKQKLERVGAAWTRPDGGICLRLHGTQIVSDDIYLYPATVADDEGAQ
ncbi:MAG: hypothetical protein ACFB6R_16025 [Alphaproteobacteria bacterium]